MNLLDEAKQGNRTFKITFPSGEFVPFRLLSWQSFNQYQDLFQKKTIPNDILEDSIFRECCLDSLYIENAHESRAGIVSTVVNMIMFLSGPSDINGFNNDLEIARQFVDSLNSQVIMIICRAFPAYKPEDIMKLQWADVLIRLAQAERILMQKAQPELTQPLRLLNPEEAEQANTQKTQQIDVNQLIKDGRKDAAEMGGRIPDDQITDVDMEVGKAAAIREKRRAMARRLDR